MKEKLFEVTIRPTQSSQGAFLVEASGPDAARELGSLTA